MSALHYPSFLHVVECMTSDCRAVIMQDRRRGVKGLAKLPDNIAIGADGGALSA